MDIFKSSLISPSIVLMLSANLFAQEIYTIQTQTLQEALEVIAKKSKLPYIVEESLIKGKKSPFIKEVNGVQSTLQAVLKNTNLEAIIKNGTIIIKKKKEKSDTSENSTSLESLVVVASASDLGSSQDGYLVNDSSNIGLWKGRSLQDTPYSLNVMSQDYMENLQVKV